LVEAAATAEGRSYALVTTHSLHPPDGERSRSPVGCLRLIAAGGHPLAVGHAPSEVFTHPNASHRNAMLHARTSCQVLPDSFEVLVVEQRPRTVTRDGKR
jgi:hypothetical protein